MSSHAEGWAPTRVRLFRNDRGAPSGQVDCGAFEIGQRAVAQSTLVGGTQNHARRLARFEGFLPTRRAQAPAVAGFEAGKAEFRHWCREVIAARFGKIEKLGRRYDANRVAADVINPGVAAAVPIKSRHRVDRAGLERFAEYVARCAAPALAAASVIPQHDRVLIVLWPLGLGLSCKTTP